MADEDPAIELQEQISQALRSYVFAPETGAFGSDDEYAAWAVNKVLAVVAPVLADRDAEIDRLHLDIQGYQVGGGYERGHEHGSAVAAKLRAELQRATDLVDELRKHITLRDKATELRLAEIRRLRAERDELRAHGVARDIGEANEQMRAELEALCAADAERMSAMVDAGTIPPGGYRMLADIYVDAERHMTLGQIRGGVKIAGLYNIGPVVLRPLAEPDTEAAEPDNESIELTASLRRSAPPEEIHHCSNCDQRTGMMGHPNGCPEECKPTAVPFETAAVNASQLAKTLAEPRVWRKGDPEPPMNVRRLRHTNSQVFDRIGRHYWQAGPGGKALTWPEMTGRLNGYELTEVVEDQPGGEA